MTVATTRLTPAQRKAIARKATARPAGVETGRAPMSEGHLTDLLR